MFLGRKNTYLYHCYYKFGKTEEANCSRIDSTLAIMNNGVEWDGKDTVYSTSTIDKKLFKF